MDIRKLQRVVVDALEDVKAQNIKVFNTIGLSDMFDRVVLASGTSNRQTRALAYRVAQQVKEAGGHVVSVEGADAGEWVLVDLGDLVVHVMQPAVREYYGLEEIWGGKPVRVKTAETGARRIVGHAQASDAEEAAVLGVPGKADGQAVELPVAHAPASTAKRAPAATPARKEATATKPAGATRAGKTPRSASKAKAANRKAPRKASGAKAARKAAAGKPARKRVGGKSAAAKKAAAAVKRAVPRKAAAKKSAARKSAARKPAPAGGRNKARGA